MGGISMSLTSEFTMAPKAAPVITPMAKSTRFRERELSKFSHGVPTPWPGATRV